MFYLSHEDFELANKAFLRAQVLDPDYPQAWLGQAALARLNGEVGQAAVLTEHAAGLSNGSVVGLIAAMSLKLWLIHDSVGSRTQTCPQRLLHLTISIVQMPKKPLSDHNT